MPSSWYSKKNVKITFFAIFLFLNVSKLIAQQSFPGNIQSPVYWFKTTQNGNIWSWDDPAIKRFTINGFSQHNTRNINFNPALFFNYEMGSFEPNIDLHNLGFRSLTLSAAIFPGYANGNLQPISDPFYELTSNNFKLSIHPNSIEVQGRVSIYGSGEWTGTNFLLKGTDDIVNAMKTGISQISQDSSAVENIWYKGSEFKLKFPFTGYIPEFLIYSRSLTNSESLRLQSYFSIKYGLTPNAVLVNSNDKVIWDPKQNAAFHHRVCAIGKDLNAALQQQHSATTYEDLINNQSSYYYDANVQQNRSLTIGFEVNDFAALSDKQFFIWGDDNQSIKSEDFYQIDPGFKGVWAARRIWMLKNDSLITKRTIVGVGGTLFTELQQVAGDKNIIPCYLLIKMIQPFNRNNIQPFSDQLLASANWQSISTRFTFGVVEELRFQTKTAKKKTLDTSRCGDVVDYKYDPNYRLSKFDNFYYIQKSPHKILEDCIERIVYIYDGTKLTFYIFGGVGPYDFKLMSNTGALVSQGNLTYQTSHTYQLLVNLPPGKYMLSITDQTNQQINKPIEIR